MSRRFFNFRASEHTDPSQMDYSPVTSSENFVDTLEFVFSFESLVPSGKGKEPMKLQLSGTSDKVWKWVKNVCPMKRKAQVATTHKEF